MGTWNKWIYAGLGWALGGPIGGIVGFALGAISDDQTTKVAPASNVIHNDFSAALLVLCAAVMKADKRVMRSELDFVKAFFTRTFGEQHTRERMDFFRELLKQDISVNQVCLQIRQHVDPASRLQLIHILFGLAAADQDVQAEEITLIAQISSLLGVNSRDFESIKAMFVKDRDAAYKILEVEKTASNEEIKKAFRRMAMKFHPDKVHHLGPEYQQDAQEKFRKINEAYEEIRKERKF